MNYVEQLFIAQLILLLGNNIHHFNGNARSLYTKRY